MSTITKPQVENICGVASETQCSACCSSSTVTYLASARRRRAWRAAAEHLNAAGLPAAVPPDLAAGMTAAGLAVWASTDRRAAA